MQTTSVTAPIVLPPGQVNSNMSDMPQEPANICTHHVFMTVHVVTGRISSDNTDCFPVTSYRGNAYITLFCIYNVNAIWLVPIKNRSKKKLLQAVTEVYAWLTARGYWPFLHKMDNETSHDIKAFIVEQVKLQYCPPNMHRTNPTKHAVRTWKNHFTAGPAGLPPLFPLAHWYQLMTQSNATLNMMCPCCLNPLLSAHKSLEGTFSFDATPIAPLGTEVLVHQKPNRRKIMGYHAAKAWYLSHAASHYPCICVIMKDMGSERITDTFQYHHHVIPFPVIMATDCILEATRHLADAINGVQEAPSDKMAAIQSLQALLLGKETPQEPEPITQPCRPKAPLAVSPPAKMDHDNPPIRIWDPCADVRLAMHKSSPPAKLPTSPKPAIIEDDIDKFDAPLIPIVANRSTRSHYVRPTQARPITRSQLREQTMHMINSAVSNALRPKPVSATATTPLPIRYAFAKHQLVLRKLITNHFLRAIIDEDRGTVLKYRHLVKNPAK
jgi:hypothetical protein